MNRRGEGKEQIPAGATVVHSQLTERASLSRKTAAANEQVLASSVQMELLICWEGLGRGGREGNFICSHHLRGQRLLLLGAKKL